MKTKNQTEQKLLELANAKAANEDGFTAPAAARGTSPAAGLGLAWSPKEVWRTRVKTDNAHKDSAPR